MEMSGNAFTAAERAAVYRAIAERRDVRDGFLTEALPDPVLQRLLAAAHHAPSVGLMQPSRFIVIRDPGVRRAVYEVFVKANAAASSTYEGQRQTQYTSLKLQGLLEAPQHLCVLCDATSTRGHNLGRLTMPETAVYSTVCAVENLWLAARAEGVGVGWVSILDPKALRDILQVPQHIVPVAYLCIGFVEAFQAGPDLERFGWEARVDLRTCVSYDRLQSPETKVSQ